MESPDTRDLPVPENSASDSSESLESRSLIDKGVVPDKWNAQIRNTAIPLEIIGVADRTDIGRGCDRTSIEIFGPTEIRDELESVTESLFAR